MRHCLVPPVSAMIMKTHVMNIRSFHINAISSVLFEALGNLPSHIYPIFDHWKFVFLLSRLQISFREIIKIMYEILIINACSRFKI